MTSTRTRRWMRNDGRLASHLSGHGTAHLAQPGPGKVPAGTPGGGGEADGRHAGLRGGLLRARCRVAEAMG